MPDWAQWLITAAAVVTAVTLLVKKVILPGYRGAGAIEDALPVFRDFTATFKGKTDTFKVIDEIAAQFRTDSGSTLRDVVNRLEVSADRSERADELLKVGVEAQKQLAERDREQVAKLFLLIDRLSIRVDQLMVAGERLEVNRAQVAEQLAAREEQLDEATGRVALDLAGARQRADDTPTGAAGAAADAASQTPDEQP